MRIKNYNIHFTNGKILSITDGIKHGNYPENKEYEFTSRNGERSYMIPKINVNYIEEYIAETNIML